jgi:hypothetical protein
MINSAHESRVSNPFATRWVRPGALPYSFSSGTDVAQLVRQMRESHWRGAIVGPHGSGKSTLLAALIPAIEAVGIPVLLIKLADGAKRLPEEPRLQIQQLIRARALEKNERHDFPKCILVVDGYEQLGRISRWRVSRMCRRHSCGLLITAHDDRRVGGMPIIFRTQSDLATVQFLVDRLLPAHGGAIQPDDVAAAFAQHNGNVRETFFELYELFEKRR